MSYYDEDDIDAFDPDDCPECEGTGFDLEGDPCEECDGIGIYLY